MAKLTGIVLAILHDAVGWVTVDVAVEHVHEDRDPECRATEERRFLDLDDADDLTVSGGENEATTPLSRPDRIPEERDDPHRECQPDGGHDPPGYRGIAQSGEDEAQRDHPGDSDEPAAFG